MSTPFPDPAALDLIARLELVARQSVEGVLAGLHPSPYFGSSVEYADHRPYTQGDDLRTIDWKLLAKTDKHYVKLYCEQTNLRAMIVLDASRSMGFAGGTDASGGTVAPSKLQYASSLAACLAYLLLRQNDAVGLAVADRALRTYIPARAAAPHFRVILDQLASTAPDRDTALGPVLHDLAGRLNRRGLVILISDLLDDVPALDDALSHFRFQRHDVIVFHVMDPAELDFTFDRQSCFRDIEGTQTLTAHPAALRKQYLARLDAFMQAVKRACHERTVAYQLARTDQPYAAMLSAYLEHRSRVTRRG